VAIEKRDIIFPSGDSHCAAWLFLPDGASPSAQVPGIAMAHGLGAVKEMYLEFFAQNFADAGLAAVLFDYRYFGASGGEPRRRVAPHEQTEDYRSALTCLSLQPEVDADRLGVWARVSAAVTSYTSAPTTRGSRRLSARSVPWMPTRS
jgi:fermentation-respiration switch protein FrsA (DUF1100 family)